MQEANRSEQQCLWKAVAPSLSQALQLQQPRKLVRCVCALVMDCRLHPVQIKTQHDGLSDCVPGARTADAEKA